MLVIRKKREDTQAKNIKSLPSKVKKKYRKKTQLKTILKKEKVTSLHQLGKKYKAKKKPKKTAKKKTVQKRKKLCRFF